MRSQIKLGRVFGIEIGLHYSWFLIAILIVFSLFSEFRAMNAAWSDQTLMLLAITTALLFFVSLLLHELAHSIVATTNGLPVREITLFALGGVSQIEKNPTSAKLEFWMAFVGPLTSAVIGAACLLASRALAETPPSPGGAMLHWLGYINLTLAAFNLLPGYPLDGGRVLRALIWWKTGDADRSTRMAARAGQVVAFGFILYGIVQFFSGAGIGGLWMAFVGWFLLSAARESYVQVTLSHALNGVHVADVMTKEVPQVDGNMNVQEFVEKELLHTGLRFFIVTEGGEMAGLITPDEIRQVPRAQWPFMTLRDAMRPADGIDTVAPEALLSSALELLGHDNLEQLPVMANGHLEGVLSRAQIVNYLKTHAELRA